MDFSRVLGLEHIILAFIVTWCSPFDLLGAQIAAKNRSAAAELKEECSEGGILLTSTKDLEKEACERTNTATAKQGDCARGDELCLWLYRAYSSCSSGRTRPEGLERTTFFSISEHIAMLWLDINS